MEIVLWLNLTQMHIGLQCQDWESNPGPVVRRAGEEPLHYMLPRNYNPAKLKQKMTLKIGLDISMK